MAITQNTTNVWPQGCLGAVSVTFDDGVGSQLERAVPLLQSHGLAATFYLMPNGDRWECNLPRWQEVAAQGHEIGNHSLTHVCARGFRSLPEGPALETTSLEDIEADILAAEDRLQAAFPDHGPRSFCYPCYQSYVGEGAGRQSYVPVVARHFVAGRGLGEVANHPLTCDLSYLWSWPSERLDAWRLIGMAERCATEGRWGVFTFHGIGDGGLPIAAHDLDRFLTHLAQHRDRIWTAPVATVAERVIRWRAAVAPAARPVQGTTETTRNVAEKWGSG